jgi:hypothetical protein
MNHQVPINFECPVSFVDRRPTSPMGRRESFAKTYQAYKPHLGPIIQTQHGGIISIDLPIPRRSGSKIVGPNGRNIHALMNLCGRDANVKLVGHRQLLSYGCSTDTLCIQTKYMECVVSILKKTAYFCDAYIDPGNLDKLTASRLNKW